MDEENEDLDEFLEETELTYLQEVAFITHEMYEAYIEAGFSPAQALWLSATQQADLTTPEG